MDKQVYVWHRKKVLDLMKDNSCLVVFSNPRGEAKWDVDRNYYYLCGNFEYGNIVMLSKIDGVTSEIMFINPYDEFKAKWVGAPLSKEVVSNASGIIDIRYLDSFDETLKNVLNNVVTLYVDLKTRENKLDFEYDFAKTKKEEFAHITVMNASDLFKSARTIKCKEELDEMRKAISITNKGILAILENMGEMYEYQLESYFDQAIKYHGATGYAFPTIAASGKNACCLHYGNNNCIAKEGDLILFDLGASYNMYCADISRTFPVSGKFTDRQKLLYNIVLEGQNVVMKHAKPGITTKELNQILIEYYVKELKNIGLIKEDKEVLNYYYHGVSHHMGLECHDLCEYTPLKAGCVISCEPGLYIASEGIGIRIEDDLLITETGCENMSEEILKTVEDIEKFMEGRNK